jgi:hypothetical protein
MVSLPTEISKIIYNKYARARNDMIETSLVSYFKELTNTIIKGDNPEKHHAVGGVVIKVLWFKKSDGRVDVTSNDFYYGGDVELFEKIKTKFMDVVAIRRGCIFEINGDFFGLKFESDINFNNNPDSNHRHSWSYTLECKDDNRLRGYKGRLIINAMKMAMIEFHAETCQKTFYEDLFTACYLIRTPDDEADEVSRSKLAFVDGTISGYCIPRYRFHVPKHYLRLICYS